MSDMTLREESLLRGHIPLQKNILGLQDNEKIEEWNFAGNGYVTDAVLRVIKNKCTNKDMLSSLKTVDLLGCSMITDYGIRSLLPCLEEARSLTKIDLSGCDKLTDNTYSMMVDLIKNNGNVKCLMKGSSVCFQTGLCTGIDTAGCPVVNVQKEGEDCNCLQSQLLIVPHSDLKTSFGEYLSSGTVQAKKGASHITGVTVGDWSMAITEVHPSSFLMDRMVSTGHGQVIIPFDASSDPKDILKHVTTTISTVVAKEPAWGKMDLTTAKFSPVQSERPFMDIGTLACLEMTEDSSGRHKLRNVCTTQQAMGVYFSRERFTRSNCCIEVLACKEQAGASKGGLLIGCLYDVLFSERNPMDSTSDVGGMVDGFELDEECKTISFGIEGDWLSEYTPGPSAQFFFMENGVRAKIKNADDKLIPASGMYPLVSVISEVITVVDLPPLVQPPPGLVSRWKTENRWVEKGFNLDCLVDKEGKMKRVTNYATNVSRSIFLGRREIRLKEKNSFTVVIDAMGVPVEQSTTLDFAVGIAGEFFKTLSTSPKDVIFSIVFTGAVPAEWTCSSCNKQNTQDSKTCEHCKDGENATKVKVSKTVESKSCQLSDSEEVALDQEFSVGDTITVEYDVLEQTEEYSQVIVRVLHNDKQIYKSNVKFTVKSTCRLVPYIGIKGLRDVLHLKNYRPTYRRPAPYRNKVTVGRLHYLDITDEGLCEFKNPFKEKLTGKVYGWFMGKTPFNKDFLEFTVEVIELSDEQLFGIGVTEPDFVEKHSFLGWKQDQLGYHADNGKYYHNDGTGSNKGKVKEDDDGKIKAGDIVTVKIAPFDKSVPIKFDADGDVASHQKLNIQFYKNKVLIYEIEHKFLGEAMYPAFSTKNSAVKIHNFYPETAALWDEIEGKKKERVKKEVEADKDTEEEFKGTEFVVVGVSSGSSDPAGKLQIVQQQLEQLDKTSWQELNNVNNCLAELERDVADMDFQDQQRYGDLCGVQDNLLSFVENSKHRLTYLTVDLSTDDNDKLRQGKEKVLKEVEKLENKLKAFQPLLYRKVIANLDLEDDLLKKLNDSKVLYASDYIRTLQQNECTGKQVMAWLRLLQFRGKLVVIDFGSDSLIVDIKFLMHLESKLLEFIPAEILKIGTAVTSLGQTSHVWENSSVDTKIIGEFLDESKPENGCKRAIMRLLLEKCLGLIRVPCLRTKREDAQAVYVIQQNVTNPPKPLTDYYDTGKPDKDFVVMKHVYSFPVNLPEYVLPLLISNTTKYGRMILLSGSGVVYQNGAVQTVIVKTKDIGRETIIVESKCYMPDVTSLDDSRLSKLTPSNVEDYTWNVFCIYTDIIDDILQRFKVIAMVTKEVPKNLVNVSVGCKHTWMKNPDCSAVVQSVCTLCERCCDKGEDCHYNGIMGDYLRQSGCCSTTTGCQTCGICISCAKELWSIRSRLRPNGNVIMEVKQTIAQKTTKLQPGEEENRSLTLRDPLKESVVALDPHVYNEVEFTSLSTYSTLLCLREESDGTILKAFPGIAARVQDLGTVPMTERNPLLSLKNGDHVKITLSDPLNVSLMMSDPSKAREDELPIEPQYFASVGREVKVIHETGIALYDTMSGAIPVGQLIAVKPMTRENNNFSVRVLATGDKGTIAMGLGPLNYAPNRQPGWNSQSIAYHADDGGIFLEAGYPTRRTQPCNPGDIMSFYIDFDRNKGFFRKNGEKMIELNLNFSKLACFPMIGFHSNGEAVEILEKEFWIPKTEQERSLTPPALSTYKYGNLWISPGDKITLTRLSPDNLVGWVVLHNPIKDPIGFKVHCVGNNNLQFFGVIEHKKNWMKSLRISSKEGIIEEVVIEWTSLESGRTYKDEDMEFLFGKTTEQVNTSSHQHKLGVKINQSDTSFEELPRVKNGVPKEKNMICMHLYKNMKLVDEYWLKYGNYQVSVEATTKLARFLLKYPKCPSYTYPRSFQKGMKFVIYMESEQAYAECVVVEVYPGGRSLALEYSPKDRTSNTTICIMTKSPALQIAALDVNSVTILPYETRNTPANLTRTFVTAPPYLLSEGAQMTLNFLHPEWKTDILKSVADCSQVFTRITVQEHNIWNAARSLMSWFPEGYEGQIFTFLPSELTQAKLMYPHPHEMFSDITVHRLCFAMNELIMSASYPDKTLFEMPMRLALHFVDIPGIHPSTSLPVDVLFGEGLNVWTYVALLSTKLFLPSYTKMMPDEAGSLSRGQIEHLLHNMLHVYTSLCGIYAASWGSIQYSPMSDTRVLRKAIKHDTSLVQVTPEIQMNPHLLTQVGNSAICKAHMMSYAITSSNSITDLQFKYDYFEPYIEHVSMFYWAHENLDKLPDDFFQKFSQLIHFQLGDNAHMLKKFTELPKGICSAENLQIVELINVGMQNLPEDIFLCKKLKILVCIHLPLKSLNVKWPEDSKLEQLDIAGTLITQFPDGIGKLTELRDLDLCHNPITDLPSSLENLKKLSILRLQGCTWLTLEGKRNQITHQQFETWHAQNPYIKYNLGSEKIEKLFTEYDTNNNGSLDEEELAAMNLEQFFKIRRLGISDINDEVTGGIPAVIFSMKSLTELHLDYNAITMVPQAINNLQNLNTLNLNHNPLLESLPGSLGHLPNIKKIMVQSCAQLRTPPTEVVSRGFESVKAYLKRLAGGFTECRRTKLMVVGLGGAGKTSLLRALMSEKKMTSGTEKEIPTDGIDIVPWTITSEDGREITYSTWDFAGQAVYYNTHQFFLSKRAVYLLLWSMRQGYEHAGLDFWLSSICCHAPGTPIIVVGTQCDLIPQAEIPEKELKERYPQIASFHRVSSITGTGIVDLQKSLLDVTLQQGYMGEKIPQVWLNFEKRILAERLTKKSYIKWEVARSYAMEQGIYDEKDVRMAVQLLHDLGTVQYFDNDFLRDYVVINPQWIVNVMACVVSAQDSPIQKNRGRFLHSDILTVWADYEQDLHGWLLRLTEDFDLTFPLPKEPVNIVPCLLPGEPPDNLKWPSVKGQDNIRETKMVYRFTYLPSGLFNRAQVRLFQFSDGKMIWKKGSLLSKNNHLALIKQSDNFELVVFVQGPRPENILFLIHEVFESIIEESFNGVSYDLYLPCPDCVTKEGTTDPDLLNAKLIQRAKDLKAPFIQCYKYFHWISMAQLQEKLPAASREVADFDFQLQQSVVALQELNNDLVVDVAILYSSADVPSPEETEKLPPALIRDDIQKWGHTCWFSENMNKVSVVDMTAAIKNCKILVVLVSDYFERDSRCCDMFLYARETMIKEIIIVVLGTSTEWMNKDLGMKIGRQERMVMAKTRSRYEVAGGRQEELKDWIGEKLHLMKQDVVFPEVFLSYCWSNSQSAAEKSGRLNTEALGWGDPRQLKAVLQEHGINCWIDTEYVGKEKKGIFADMAAGIRNSKVMLACISDEYAESDNCMMELRFGIINMELPLVTCIVGTKSGWKLTEVAMLLRRAQANEVNLQKENPEGINVLVKFVKDELQKVKLAGRKKKEDAKDLLKIETKSKKETKASSVAYQEEFELIQRKFMRHIIGSILAVDTMPLPRLIVVDFVKGTSQRTDEGRDSSVRMASKSRKVLRPKTATKSRDRLQVDENALNEDDQTDWTQESFHIRLLCEYEGGWHLSTKTYPLAFRTRDSMEQFLSKAAPYLYRIYTILKQSPIKLKCFTGPTGDTYQKWITEQSEENLDFVGAMMHLRSHLATDEAADFVSTLARCRLPSGKIVWLCDKHQKEEHIAKLSTGSRGSSYNVTKVLFNEDKYFLENLEKSEIYKKLKAVKSNNVAPKLPQPVAYSNFLQMPAPPPPDADDKTKNRAQSPIKRDDKKPEESTKTDRTPPKKEEKPIPSQDKEQLDSEARKQDAEKSRGDGKEELKQTPNETKGQVNNVEMLEEHVTKQEDAQNKKADGNPMLKHRRLSKTRKSPQQVDSPIPEESNYTENTHKQEMLEENLKEIAQTNKLEEKVENGLAEEDIVKPKKTSDVKPKRKESISRKELNEQEKEKIKKMILQSDSKALNNALKKTGGRPVAQGSISVQPSDMKTLNRRQNTVSFSSIMRGSNVKRILASNIDQSKNDEQKEAGSRSSSRNSSVNLESALQINTVSGGKSEAAGGPKQVSLSGISSKKSKSAESGKADTYPLDRVRPKKIKVQPHRSTENKQGSKNSLTTTGIKFGVTKGSEMPLPERTDSKACSLQ